MNYLGHTTPEQDNALLQSLENVDRAKNGEICCICWQGPEESDLMTCDGCGCTFCQDCDEMDPYSDVPADFCQECLE